MPSVKKLKTAINTAMEDYPPDVDKDGNVTATFCNLALRDICQEFGYVGFNNMMANEIVKKLRDDWAFALVDEATAQKLALDGQLVIAGCMGEPHGHVACVYPDSRPMLASNKWGGIECPWIGNVGMGNEDHVNVIVAANYAFRQRPKYWAYISNPDVGL